MGYRSDLHCHVESLVYNFKTQIGTLNLLENNSCDMSGCIALFKKIDEGVKRIETFAGSALDITYILSGSGWRAYDKR